MHKHLLASGLTVALSLLSTAACAQSIDLGTWTRIGDATATSATTAVLSTGAVDSGETPLSGQSAQLTYDLEPLLFDLTIATSLLPGNTFEGSAMTTTLSTTEPMRFSFNWTLSTAGYDVNFEDIAFAVIDGTTFQTLGTIGSANVNGLFSHTFTSSGLHTLSFGVLDVNDVSGMSTLHVSQVSASAVPEPSGLLLSMAGLGALGLIRRRSDSLDNR